MISEATTIEGRRSYHKISLRACLVIATFYFFILSLELMGGAFALTGKEVITRVIQATSNPFVGLLIGLLATAILQSSSTVTSILVAIVGTGTISLKSAIPIVMGANIGTTITCTIVSLGYLRNLRVFRKAFATASLHGIFNIFAALVIFPIEYTTGWFSATCQGLAAFFTSPSVQDTDSSPLSFLGLFVRPVSSVILGSFGNQGASLILLFSVITLFVCLKSLTFVSQSFFGELRKEKLDKYIFQNTGKSVVSGFTLTALMQSSSLISSLVVTLVASSKVTFQKSFPFLVGMNIGTTFTALFAAFTQPYASLTIALAHLLFNLIGMLLMLPVPFRNFPLWIAQKLGMLVVKNRIFAFVYLLLIFFLIPFFLIYFSMS